jgi:hypothetical protein
MNVVAEGGGGYREVTIIEHATCLSPTVEVERDNGANNNHQMEGILFGARVVGHSGPS